MKGVHFLFALAVLACVAFAFSQNPATLQLNVPDHLTSKQLVEQGYKAYELASSASLGEPNWISTLSQSSSFNPAQPNDSRLSYFEKPIYWSKLENEHIGPAEYLIVYRPEAYPLTLNSAHSALASPREFAFRLFLIKLDSITVIAPRPNIAMSSILLDAAFYGFTESVESDEKAPESGASLGGMPDVYRNRALHTVDLSHIKQIALGLLMYQNDYDDYYPYVQTSKTLKSLLNPYLKNPDLWNTMNPAGSEYYFNMSLAGANGSAVDEPANTPMLFETKPWADGVRAVAFANGHAQLLAEPEWRTIANKLKLSLKKQGKPLPP